jgi:hypothetical protein
MDEWRAIDIVTETQRRQHTAYVTAEGAEWLASASAFPRSVRALWAARPTTASVLPCGTAFDVVNLSAVFGRRVLERLWSGGPGSGPVAVQRGRLLLFVAPGTAHRLPALLDWEEWGSSVPPMLCHGSGDAVTVPPLYGPEGGTYARTYADTYAGTYAGTYAETLTGSCTGGAGGDGGSPRWLVAPDTRHPWLPGADHLLWACVRAARATPRKSTAPQVSPPSTT